ncbi:MAG: alpha/beta hydrolase [Pseudomonadota bacterium]
MIPGTTRHTAEINGIKMFWMEAGEGAPVYLLHGWPETSFAWRKQIPALAGKYKLVIPDLRGYGETAKPAGGYDKRTMAADIRALMRHLGHERIALVGHDRGARVSTRFAKDYRDAIDRLVVMDNIPTRVVFQSMNAKIAKGYWFFTFNQVPDLPEALIQGREEIWLRHFYSTWSYDPQMMTHEEVAEYVRAYAQPGGLRGGFNDYRAGAEDLAQDMEDAAELINCPILTLWGRDFDLVGGMFDVLEVWKGMGTNVQGMAIPQCGHLPQEEQPGIVNAELLRFLDGWAG